MVGLKMESYGFWPIDVRILLTGFGTTSLGNCHHLSARVGHLQWRSGACGPRLVSNVTARPRIRVMFTDTVMRSRVPSQWPLKLRLIEDINI